jgi:hypothetical protein
MHDKAKKLAAFAGEKKPKFGGAPPQPQKGARPYVSLKDFNASVDKAKQATEAAMSHKPDAPEHKAAHEDAAAQHKAIAETHAAQGNTTDAKKHEALSQAHSDIAKGKGHLETGPKGGHYYVSPSGSKTYIG